MFFHQYFYRIKQLLHSPSLLFWPFLYPIILGAIFVSTIGVSMSKEIGCKTIPVAVVDEVDQKETENFHDIIKTLTFTNDVLMFSPTFCSSEEATKQLTSDQVKGIITINDDLSLTVNASGLEQSILKSFLDSYRQQVAIFKDMATQNPDAMQSAMQALASDTSSIVKKSTSGREVSPYLQYYYALIAMACLFACYIGLSLSRSLVASATPLAMRRCTSASNKSISILADFFAALTLHFIELIIVWSFLYYVLKVPIGSLSPVFFVILFFGCMLGIAFGQFVGAVSKGSEGVCISILTVISLISCFFSGLMVGEMKGILEKSAPIVNRINPATLITDAIYCLDVYSDNTRLLQDLATLIAITVLLLVINFLLIRRQRYENL